MNTLIKSKAKINLIIDAVMLILLMAMAGLGFLIKYILVAGFKRNEMYEGDVELYFLGLTRHDWGDIHLWLGFSFIFLLLIHIILHWGIIVCIFRQMVPGKFSRTLVPVIILFLTLFFGLAPFLVKPEVLPLPRRHANRVHIETPVNESHATGNNVNMTVKGKYQEMKSQSEDHTEGHHEHSGDELEIYGYMTLDEVSSKFGIPSEELTKALHIPSEQSNLRIGLLKRRYGLEMEDIKDVIRNSSR